MVATDRLTGNGTLADRLSERDHAAIRASSAIEQGHGARVAGRFGDLADRYSKLQQ